MPITSVKGKGNNFAKQMMMQQNKAVKKTPIPKVKTMKSMKGPKGC